MSQQQKISIIGAGIAGLSLAQGLKQANIFFRIFERDTSSSFRVQGYRIRIGPDGVAALRRLLPAYLWNAFEATSADVVHSGCQIDAKTGESTQWGGRGPPGRAVPDGKAYNVDRAILRELLLCGLEDSISFDKRLERYEVHGDEIIANFVDGSTERSTFLVGADGLRSAVRRQLLPNMVILDTEGRAVFGKTPLCDEATHDIADGIGHGISLIADGAESRMKLFTDGMRFDRQRSSEFQEQLGLHVPADYIYWVLLFRKDVLGPAEDELLLRLTSEQSVEKSLNLTVGWNESLRAVLKHQDPKAASTLAFLTASSNFVSECSAKPPHLRSRIILIGDSLHPMPPVGGIGANAGLQDSADLCDALKSFCDIEEEDERHKLITACEERILLRAKQAVDRSSSGAGHFFGMRPFSELKAVAL